MITPPTTPTTPTPSDVPPETLAVQILDHLARGGVLGDLLDMDERDYELLYALGHDMYTQGKYEDAVNLFGFLVMRNHQERRFIMAYAAALQMTRDYVNAISLYTLASVLDLRDPQPGFYTCECLIGLGLKNEACQGLAIVVRQCGNAHAGLRDRAQALLDLLSPPSPTTGATTNPGSAP